MASTISEKNNSAVDRGNKIIKRSGEVAYNAGCVVQFRTP